MQNNFQMKNNKSDPPDEMLQTDDIYKLINFICENKSYIEFRDIKIFPKMNTKDLW